MMISIDLQCTFFFTWN